MAQKTVLYVKIKGQCHMPGYGLEEYGWEGYVCEMLLGVAVCGTRNDRKDVYMQGCKLISLLCLYMIYIIRVSKQCMQRIVFN